VILAQAEGSSGPELLRTISSITVTVWPLVTCVTISLLSLAWPRTLTLLATTIAGPATSGIVRNSGQVAVFRAGAFFTGALCAIFGVDFFFAALAAGAFVLAAAGARSAGGAATGIWMAAGGAVSVASCASKLVESIIPNTNQQLYFIIQHIRDLISGSVNIRHLPGRSSPSLIFPIWIRCNRLTVIPCDSNNRRTSRFLP